MSLDVETARGSIRNWLTSIRRKSRIADAYKAVYSTDPGQTVVHDIMRRGGLLETAADPTDSRFHEGRRSLALHVVEMLRWSESEILTLAERSQREDMERLVE